jgi:tetratricopeptide (TPR) repeat protein
LRGLDVAAYASAKSCLETLIAADPGFATGYGSLAFLYARIHQFGLPLQAGDEPMLDRALRMARRSIELNPASSRSWGMLMEVLFLRREVPEAFAAGERAIALNKYDLLGPTEYGGRLIMVGEAERGLAMMRRAVGTNAVRPAWQHFYLFMGSYLAGDLKDASYQASQITESYTLGHLARALAAAAAGDSERARQSFERLMALQPGWRTSPRNELAQLSPNPLVVERLEKALSEAGLPGA